MKKITLLFLFCLTAITWSYGQCTNTVYQYPPTTVNITATPGLQQIAPDNWPQNEFSVVNGLVPGESYTITATPDQTDPDYTPGAMTYITVTSDGTSIIVDGFDSVSFVATTAEITIYWTLDAACNNGPNLNTLTEIECTTCTCSATVAPGCVTEIAPVDGDMSVILGANNSVTFEWNTDPLADTYELFINGFSQGIRSSGITFTGFAPLTAYTWQVVPSNCFATASGPCPTWSFTTAACTETTPPPCSTNLVPTDNQMNVATVEADDLTREVALSWDAVTGADSYEITFDGNVLGSTPDTTVNIFGLDYDTTYTWSIGPANCFGAATCATFTFTTEADPSLSVAQFDSQSLSVFPNPVKDQLTIKTELSIESVDIFNILGKSVKSISGESMLDDRVNMSDLLDGIYFLNVTAEGKKQTIKVIKQ